jgi:hypothetical protein
MINRKMRTSRRKGRKREEKKEKEKEAGERLLSTHPVEYVAGGTELLLLYGVDGQLQLDAALPESSVLNQARKNKQRIN